MTILFAMGVGPPNLQAFNRAEQFVHCAVRHMSPRPSDDAAAALLSEKTRVFPHEFGFVLSFRGFQRTPLMGLFSLFLLSATSESVATSRMARASNGFVLQLSEPPASMRGGFVFAIFAIAILKCSTSMGVIWLRLVNFTSVALALKRARRPLGRRNRIIARFDSRRIRFQRSRQISYGSAATPNGSSSSVSSPVTVAPAVALPLLPAG